MAWLTLQSWNAATGIDTEKGHFQFRRRVGPPAEPQGLGHGGSCMDTIRT